MIHSRTVVRPLARTGLVALGFGLLLLLTLPLLSLLLQSSPIALWHALAHPLVLPALWLSARTTAVTLSIVVAAGTPLAWLLSRSKSRWSAGVEAIVELPIVMPPAVLGIALLLAFGRHGLLGGLLADLGVGLPFSTAAVVVAQVVVAAPFYVQSATAGFRRVDDDLLLVARTLGASSERAFVRVALPVALPAMVSGAALSWARAAGEFGATLLFAGNLPGRTQTMPLAIYAALETDVVVAQAIAVILGIASLTVLLAIRFVPRWPGWSHGPVGRGGADRGRTR